MNAFERRQLENRLIVMWAKVLQSENPGELLPELAKLIIDDKQLLGLINSCDQKERSALYGGIKPYLPFEPKELSWYEARLKEHASQIASKADPIEIGERTYIEVPKQIATGCVVDMRCACGRTSSFYGDTVLAAVILARQDGWVREMEKEICPKCPAETRSQRRKCPGCTRRHYAPECRMIAAPKQRQENVRVN